MINSKKHKAVCKNGPMCTYYKRNKCYFYHPPHHLSYTPITKIDNPTIKWFFLKTPHFKMHPQFQQNQCPICLEEYKKKDIITQLYCKHAYHYKCIQEWLEGNVRCPLCKQDFRKYPQFERYSDFEEAIDDDDGSDWTSSFVEHISIGQDDEYSENLTEEEEDDWYYNENTHVEPIELESDNEHQLYENSENSDIEIDLPYEFSGGVSFTTNFGHLTGEVKINYGHSYGDENDFSDQQW